MRALHTVAAVAALLLTGGLAHSAHGPTPDYTHLSVVVSHTHLVVGETLAVRVTGSLGMPRYRLFVTPAGVLVPVRPKPGAGGLIQYASSGGVTFTFRAARPGKVTLTASANGEIHDAACGCFKWANATSPTVGPVIVSPRKRSRG